MLWKLTEMWRLTVSGILRSEYIYYNFIAPIDFCTFTYLHLQNWGSFAAVATVVTGTILLLKVKPSRTSIFLNYEIDTV